MHMKYFFKTMLLSFGMIWSLNLSHEVLSCLPTHQSYESNQPGINMTQDRRDYKSDLIEKLETLSLNGPSRGGPYVGISHNDVTRAIVAEGEAIIPLLVDKLKTSNLTETIFIVFCLRELKAKSAKEKIQQLQSSERFSNLERDMTLEMQIRFFLRDVDSW